KYSRSPGAHKEWIAACKGDGQTNSSFAQYAGPLTEMVLLGDLAVRTGRVLELNPETGQVANATIPEEYIRPTYRSGWSVELRKHGEGAPHAAPPRPARPGG